MYRMARVPLKESHEGNTYFEIGREPYVLHATRIGTLMLGIRRGLWKKVDRVI